MRNAGRGSRTASTPRHTRNSRSRSSVWGLRRRDEVVCLLVFEQGFSNSQMARRAVLGVSTDGVSLFVIQDSWSGGRGFISMASREGRFCESFDTNCSWLPVRREGVFFSSRQFDSTSGVNLDGTQMLYEGISRYGNATNEMSERR